MGSDPRLLLNKTSKEAVPSQVAWRGKPGGPARLGLYSFVRQTWASSMYGTNAAPCRVLLLEVELHPKAGGQIQNANHFGLSLLM